MAKSLATTVATPSKWPGSRGPFPSLADADDRNRRGDGRGPVRVHLTHRGSEHHVDARPGADVPVPVQGAGIVRDVLGITELEGVDENADGDHVVLGPRPGHEGDMAGMQCAHRRDQPDGATGGPGLLEQFAAFGHGLDDPHDSDHRRNDGRGGGWGRRHRGRWTAPLRPAGSPGRRPPDSRPAPGPGVHQDAGSTCPSRRASQARSTPAAARAPPRRRPRLWSEARRRRGRGLPQQPPARPGRGGRPRGWRRCRRQRGRWPDLRRPPRPPAHPTRARSGGPPARRSRRRSRPRPTGWPRRWRWGAGPADGGRPGGDAAPTPSSPREPERCRTVVPGCGATEAATPATTSSGVAMTRTSTPEAASVGSS